MDANTKDQILNLIDKSQSILLLTHAKADCDGLGSMISMYLVLQALGKEVTAATNDPAPEVLSFLPSINIVQNSVSSNNFVITLDIRNTPLNKIKYKLAEDHSKVNIIVTPRNGRFKTEDVSLGQEERHFDLIITFDTGNLEHLGPIYDQNAELFFNTPVINIDHHASNTDYGQVNYVDVVSASTTEMMLKLLQEMEGYYQKNFLNPDIATLLLAGLITDTGSFQHSNTSPRAMEVAAKLLDLGARQQEIIKNIYKTKKLTTLKLWGTVLSKVETDPIYRLVWSSINKSDLAETGASAEESEGVIDDLLSNAPGAEIIMLFKYNEEGYVSVSMRSTTNSVDVGKICAEMGGGGHIRAAGLKRRDGSSLEKLIEDTLSKTREYQGNRLNIHPDMIRSMSQVQTKKIEEKPIQPPSTEKSNESLPQSVQYLEFKGQQETKPLERPLNPPENLKAPEKAPEIKPEEKNQVLPKPEAVKSKPEKTQRQATASKKEGKSVEVLKREFVSKSKEETAPDKPIKEAPSNPPSPEQKAPEIQAPSPTPQPATPAPQTPISQTPPPVSPQPEPQAIPPTNPIPPVINPESQTKDEIPPAPME